MKVSNETKVGALALVAITCLILGFNFLKGKTFFSKDHKIYAKYANIQGLLKSNAVTVNGMQIGSVYDIQTDKNLREILVTINLTKEVNLPDNSIAVIKPNPLGATIIEIKLGNTSKFLEHVDTIKTISSSAGLLDAAMDKLDPVLGQVKGTLSSLDSVLLNVNGVVDANAKGNIQAMLANLNKTTASLAISGASLQNLLNTQSGVFAKTLGNVNSFTGNLANNNEKVTSLMTNLEQTTKKFSNLDIERTLSLLNTTVTELKNTIVKLNSADGTLGLMMNDPKLYNNLTATSNKLNTLLDDVKTHPKRYINVSVFGRKDKNKPLDVPLPDTLNAPYFRK